jgi:acyl dehydratase
MARYFDDIRVGEAVEFGGYTMSEPEIIDFAERYDPQPFHTDPAAAKASHFGGLIASGWHTSAVVMRMMVANLLDENSMGSPGVDELRWLKPVRPGDTLRVRATVIEARESQSRPDRGMVRSRFEILNQHNKVVMTMTAMTLVRRRPRAGT